MINATRFDVGSPFGAPEGIPGFFADPDLHIFNGTYWLYATTDGRPDWSATSFHAFSSADLVHWTDWGEVFDVRSSGWAHGYAWAPGVTERGGSYYLYYTADQGSIGVAIASSPTGPFVDIGRPLVADGAFPGRAIDPSVFADDDGRYFLYWGNTVLHAVELGADMTEISPNRVQSWMPRSFREAGWVHRYRDLYYLSWSVDDTRSENYRVEYASGPGPLGPWTSHGTLLEKNPGEGVLATGHHSIVKLPDVEEWVIAYHRFAIPDGDGYRREIRFDRLTHERAGTIARVVPSTTRFARPLSISRQSH